MDFREKWEALLSDKRVRIEGGRAELRAAAPTGGRSPYEVDCERIVFAAPFRRLARKTQVHPFSEVDYVHNRLTHSLEVSSVCGTLARAAGERIAARGDLPPERIAHLCQAAQAAGLAHDIGNPPYGHSGERAIRAWAEHHSDELGGDPVWDDFRFFDGNAQTLRMACRPDLRDQSYFRLTAASLGALVKYPATARDAARTRPDAAKFAVFTTEEEIFCAVWGELGLARADGTFARHPLSYLSEAADDICYRIADFEDAVLMDLLPYGEVSAIFAKLIAPDLRGGARGRPIQHLRALAIRHLIDVFSGCFEAHYEEIMEGRFQGDLRSRLAGDEGEALDEIQRRYEVLFSNHRKVIAEIGSYSQIDFILTHYLKFISRVDGGGCRRFQDLPPIARQLVQLAWGRGYYELHAHETTAWWAHATLDFVAGMTDDYINSLAHRLGA